MPESNSYGKKLITWEFPEFVEHERGRNWYVIAIVLSALALIYSLFIGNFLFAIIIMIAAAILFLKKSQGPNQLEFVIWQTGVSVGNRFYSFEEIQDFYLIYEPPEVKNIYFHFKSSLQPRMQISLENINPLKVREILLQTLEENLEQRSEPFSDAFGRIFKI